MSREPYPYISGETPATLIGVRYAREYRFNAHLFAELDTGCALMMARIVPTCPLVTGPVSSYCSPLSQPFEDDKLPQQVTFALDRVRIEWTGCAVRTFFRAFALGYQALVRKHAASTCKLRTVSILGATLHFFIIADFTKTVEATLGNPEGVVRLNPLHVARIDAERGEVVLCELVLIKIHQRQAAQEVYEATPLPIELCEIITKFL